MIISGISEESVFSWFMALQADPPSGISRTLTYLFFSPNGLLTAPRTFLGLLLRHACHSKTVSHSFISFLK